MNSLKRLADSEFDEIAGVVDVVRATFVAAVVDVVTVAAA